MAQRIMPRNFDSLSGLALFALIVQYGSMSRAAEHSGLSRSAVSKQLSALEAKLGLRLLQRSTRKLTLTEAGEKILDEAIHISDALENVETLSEGLRDSIRGRLKVSCSSGIGKTLLVPLLRQFYQEHPDVHVQLLLEDRSADLIDEQVDVAIRVGHLPDSAQIARRLGRMTWAVCASPAYLERNGTPKKPSDLLKHDCLVYCNSQNALNNWPFVRANEEERIKVDGPLSINDSTALVQAAEMGMGILWVDKNVLGDALEKGRLVSLLDDYSLGPGFPVYALYPARRLLSAKTRVFVDFLVKNFTPVIEFNSK